jgi:hypothetical protein
MIDCWPAVLIVCLAVLAMCVVVWDRHHHDPKKGIGVRAIQFLAVVLLIPSIVVLSLVGKLEGQATATLLGTIVGYVLSAIGKDEGRGKEKARS